MPIDKKKLRRRAASAFEELVRETQDGPGDEQARIRPGVARAEVAKLEAKLDSVRSVIDELEAKKDSIETETRAQLGHLAEKAKRLPAIDAKVEGSPSGTERRKKDRTETSTSTGTFKRGKLVESKGDPTLLLANKKQMEIKRKMMQWGGEAKVRATVKDATGKMKKFFEGMIKDLDQARADEKRLRGKKK